MATEVRSTPRSGHDAAGRRSVGAVPGTGQRLGPGGALWRHKLLLLAFVAVGLGLAAAYLDHRTPTFEATTLVALDTAPGSVPAGQEERGTAEPQESLETELNIIESSAMAERLVDRLNLQLLEEFNPALRARSDGPTDLLDAGRGLLAVIHDHLPKAWADSLRIAPSSGVELTDQERAARLRDWIIETVRARIGAHVARPSVLSLSFVSEDPQLAASAANTLAELYLAERPARRSESSERAREELAAEIERLTASVRATETAIERYRKTPDAQAERPDEPDMLGLTGELAFWRSERGALEARQRQAQSALQPGADLAQAAQALDAPQLGELQAREAGLRQLLTELAQQYGEQDPQIVDLRTQLAALEEEKRREIEQIADGLKSELEIIRSREAALEEKIASLDEHAAEGQAVGDVEVLEQQLAADRTLLRSYLARAEQLEVPQTAQATDARIVAPAVVPQQPRYPRVAVIYGVALAGGLLVGILAAFGLEARRRARA